MDATKIVTKSNKLLKVAFKHHKDYLLSDTAKQYREVIQLLESKKELKNYSRAYFLLFTLEYYRRNYNAAIDCLCFTESDASWTEVVSLYQQLIMLRLKSQECQLSDFIRVIKGNYKKGNEAAISKLFEEAVFTFRSHKMYDSAIRLEIAFGSLMRSPLKSKLSLAMTYLEQYRLEFSQRSEIRNEDIRDIHALIMSTLAEHPPNDNHSYEYDLVLAQYYYFMHAVYDDEKVEKEMISISSAMVSSYLESEFRLLSSHRCFTCNQAVTKTEVQYVCSGCRVACYCSIDHQRMTWKKEAVRGLRIGHEILCPLFKVCRKYARARVSRDAEKESRMQRRFDRECLKFLKYGLGLKNKCFPCNDEVQSLLLHS